MKLIETFKLICMQFRALIILLMIFQNSIQIHAGLCMKCEYVDELWFGADKYEVYLPSRPYCDWCSDTLRCYYDEYGETQLTIVKYYEWNDGQFILVGDAIIYFNYCYDDDGTGCLPKPQ